MKRAIALTGLLLLAGCGATEQATPEPSSPPDLYAFSLVAPTEVSPSGLVARAVVPQGTRCPDLQADGRQLPMLKRWAPRETGKAFAGLLVCSAPIPPKTSSASVAGVSIPAAMPSEVDTIAAIADTGCMVSKVVQNCSPRTWPFAANAQQISKSAPDLIIHVGDYFYRERACPPDKTDRCGGSPAPLPGMPFLDSAEGWLADFFEPARPMLTTAPLLAVRGNHEECQVAGNGYFLYLDPREDTENTCAPRDGKAPSVLTDTWSVDVAAVGGSVLRLIVVDSSYGWDYGLSPWWPRLRPGYKRAAVLAKDDAVQPWLIVHEPSLGITTSRFNPGNVKGWTPWVAVDQAAASHGLLRGFDAMLSGHLHLNEVIKVPGLPPQFIAGAGGTRLDRPKGYRTPKVGALADSGGNPLLPGVRPYRPASYRWTNVEHGFALAKPQPAKSRWNVQFVRPDGSTITSCSVTAGTPSCA